MPLDKDGEASRAPPPPPPAAVQLRFVCSTFALGFLALAGVLAWAGAWGSLMFLDAETASVIKELADDDAVIESAEGLSEPDLGGLDLGGLDLGGLGDLNLARDHRRLSSIAAPKRLVTFLSPYTHRPPATPNR